MNSHVFRYLSFALKLTTLSFLLKILFLLIQLKNNAKKINFYLSHFVKTQYFVVANVVCTIKSNVLQKWNFSGIQERTCENHNVCSWNFKWVSHNFAEFPGVKACFNFWGQSSKSEQSKYFSEKYILSSPVSTFSGIAHFTLNLQNFHLHPISYTRNLHSVM